MTTARKRLFDIDLLRGKLYSGGWVDGDALVDVTEPATGATLLRVGLGSADTVARAAKLALEAQKKWVDVPPEEKRQLFLRAERLLEPGRLGRREPPSRAFFRGKGAALSSRAGRRFTPWRDQKSGRAKPPPDVRRATDS